MEIPPTDSENESESGEVASTKVRKFRRIIASEDEESSDEEDQLRHSRYEAESDLEEHQPTTEEQAYSKATRRSITGYIPRVTKALEPDESSDDDSIIIGDSGDEKPVKEEPDQWSAVGNSTTIDQSSEDPLKNLHESLKGKSDNGFTSDVENSMKELSRLSNESFDNSIGVKMSSTISKEDSYLLDEAAGGCIEKVKVSQSSYDAAAAEKMNLETQIATMKKMLRTSHTLPDGGEKLRSRLNVLQAQLDQKKLSLSSMEIDESKSIKSEITKSFNSDFGNKSEPIVVIDDAEDFKKVDNVKQIHFGAVGMKNFEHQKALTVEKLQDIQQCIDARPLETELATPPKYLKVDLMNHQLHALKFMMWRETQMPRGGILADDMGLGKTLTAISLILKGVQASERGEESESDEEEEDEEGDKEWKARGRKDLHDGGTLVVCPASLLKQWEHEISERTKGKALTVNAFHGPKREYKSRRLARYDIVLTTYQLVVNEEKNNGCLYGIKWKRIILDEGHVIRNHKSKQSEAICKLMGKYRWVMSGTPIQNKEFDLYAAIKFLKCRPFDEVAYWKRWIEVKGQDSSPRVQALLKAILLRRTKQQLMESGEVQTLPNKVYKQFNVKLNQEERIAYSKFLSFSQSLFANYLAQHQEKHDNFTYNKNDLNRIYKKFAKKVNIDREVKAHELLTVLMRLRQICCHPGLVKESLLRHENDAENELVGDHEDDGDHDESDGGLLKKLEQMDINGDEEDSEIAQRQFSTDSQVFNMDVPSSKICHMMQVLREHIVGSEDKAIIVSQWTSYLAIIRGMLEVDGITYCELNGTVPVKNRNDIVVNFNNKTSGIQVMLLSLTAGGVGLNLVGANYLFLMDLHWNPQLEQQAQDRIYRFGQKKEVNVFK